MAIGIDSVANANAVSPPTNSIPVSRQAPIHPGTDRARSNDRQQKDQAKNGASFQAELEAVETAADKFVAEASARRAERKTSSADKPLRAEKRPQDNPAEVNADEGADLFVQAQARTASSPQRRSTDAGYNADGFKGHIPASQEFMVAASRYAERVFAQGGAYAKPGESLELTA